MVKICIFVFYRDYSSLAVLAIALQSTLGTRLSVHESEWFPDECRRIEQLLKKLDLQIQGWDGEDPHAAIRNDGQEELDNESDMVVRKTFEAIEMKDPPPMQHPNTDNLIFMVRPCFLNHTSASRC